MCRTGMCRFGIKNWIFLLVSLQLFTYAQGGETTDFGVRWQTEPGDVVAVAGQRVVLPCVATARHALRLAWRHDVAAPPTRDHTIEQHDKYRKQVANGSLVIESVSATLAGHYQCVATADGVGTIVSRVATVFLAELPSISAEPRSVVAAAGGAALLPCALAAPPRPALRPAPAADRRVYAAPRAQPDPPLLRLNVTWMRNNAAVRLEPARVWVSASGALELDPLRAHDAGAYACRVALADRPDTYKLGPAVELAVAAAPEEAPPRFLATPRALTVLEGASVTLDCAATGNPKPEITWLNNGVAIDLNDLDSRLYLSGGGSLRVQWARALDAGAYTCRASNRLDSVDHTTTLTVLTAPRVSLAAAGTAVRARARGDVTLRCAARGRPQPHVVWLKDGEPLSPNNHDIVLVDGTSLRIQGVLKVDGGMFQCAALSAAGAAVAALRLVVLPPDDGPNASLPFPDFLGETAPAFTPPPDYESPVPEGVELGNGTAGAGAAPRGLRAVIVKHRFVTLSWDPPDGDDDVTGYAVVYRVEGSERWRVAAGGRRHELTVAGLSPDTRYQFAVHALRAAGASPPTPPLSVSTPREEAWYAAPRGVSAAAAGPHALRVTWTRAAPLGDRAPPDKYTLHYTEVESGRPQFQVIEVDPSLPTVSHTLTGLRAGSLYSLGVSAGGGAPGESVSARTEAAAPGEPPANVTVTAAGSTTLVVRWDAAARGAALTGYKVRFRAARRKPATLATPADARRAELSGLDPNTTYQVRVAAINAVGAGPFSEWVAGATRASDPDDAGVPDTPPPINSRAGRDWISVWWAESGASGVRGYLLGWGRGVPDETARDLPAHTHAYVIRKLVPNSEYVISLRASNSRGLGPPVYTSVRTRAAAELDELDDELDEPLDERDDERDGEDEPAPLIPPVGVKAIMLSGTTAVVYWTDPTLPKGQSVADGRRYVVRWAAVGGGERARYFNATDLNCMLDELRPFTNYEFSVKLIQGARSSPWSMVVWNTSLEAPPGAPRELRAAPAAPPARAVDLTWAPPARPNGLITGYVIMYTVASAPPGEWTAVAAAGERGRARVERLRARTTYLFKVQARNSKGLGPFCAPVTYSTLGEASGGLAGSTSAWLWASAGGACAVLALAAALALSLCCRRAPAPLSPDTSTYQKSAASAAIKPPDLWIHHDQMELKHLDKGLHASASKISAGSAEGALVSSSLSMSRGEYEPARLAPHPPASLDRRHYVPTYVECGRSSSCAGSDETCPLRASPLDDCAHLHPHPHPAHMHAMTGMGVGVGCAATCERRARPAGPGGPGGPAGLAGGLASPQSSLASLAPLHPPPPPCGVGGCGGGDIYACAARERGHYVAYEPLGHYTHRESLSSEAGVVGGLGGAGGGSLGRRGGPPALPAGAGPPGALHSFALSDNASDHSTPTHSHSRGSARETSPYKKSASSSPGHLPNRLQLGSSVCVAAEELEPLTPSRSTERLQREMQNLEGLMKDLSAITQHQFHC